MDFFLRIQDVSNSKIAICSSENITIIDKKTISKVQLISIDYNFYVNQYMLTEDSIFIQSRNLIKKYSLNGMNLHNEYFFNYSIKTFFLLKSNMFVNLNNRETYYFDFEKNIYNKMLFKDCFINSISFAGLNNILVISSKEKGFFLFKIKTYEEKILLKTNFQENEYEKIGENICVSKNLVSIVYQSDIYFYRADVLAISTKPIQYISRIRVSELEPSEGLIETSLLKQGEIVAVKTNFGRFYLFNFITNSLIQKYSFINHLSLISSDELFYLDNCFMLKKIKLNLESIFINGNEKKEDEYLLNECQKLENEINIKKKVELDEFHLLKNKQFFKSFEKPKIKYNLNKY
jgi:hypothetical protein